MTKRAFGRREGEEQIPWLMHTCPRLLPRWSSKRLLRNKGLRLFLAGLDWSADFAAGTVHGMEVGIGLPCTNCSEQRCEIVCGELLRSESYYVSGRESTLDRPSLLGARPGSMGWCGVVTKEDGYTAIDVRLSHVDVGEHDVRPQAFVGQYKEGLRTHIMFSHIHVGQPNVNGGVTVFFCDNTTPPHTSRTCPEQAGTVQGAFTTADVIGLTSQQLAAHDFAALLAAIRARQTYANLHTMDSPGGEIRGPIKPGKE